MGVVKIIFVELSLVVFFSTLLYFTFTNFDKYSNNIEEINQKKRNEKIE
jgi:hypothetical protein